MKTKLFLHMGPGFHSQIEKKKYGSYTAVEFWNQPACKNFDALVAAACDKTSSLAKQVSQPISLIAHSFGGQLARHIQLQQPQSVKEIIMVNSALDPFECFINLAPHVNPDNANFDFDTLRKASVQKKMDFILGLAASPILNELYWHSKKKLKELSPLFSEAPPLSIEVFLSIFPDFLSKASQFPQSTQWQGKVKVYHSLHDRLLNKEKDVDVWNRLFPQAQFFRHSDSGHYLHLEDTAVARDIFS